MIRRKAVILLAIFLLFLAMPAFGQHINTLATIPGLISPYGYGGLLLSGNTLYGAAANNDQIFSIPTSGGTPTVLANIGISPGLGLILFGGTLYGTTNDGETGGGGAVFSLPIGGGTPAVLASFAGTDLSSINSGLVYSNGTLYGTAFDGGVFSVPIDGGPPTVLTTGGQVANPKPGLVLYGNTLYGITFNGEVFSVPTGGGKPTEVASFQGQGLGLILAGQTLYGTTAGGGSNDDGEVFSVPLDGGAPTVLATFTGAPASDPGLDPDGNLVVSGGTLYGTTAFGGAYNDGEIFSLPISGGTPNVLASFDGTDGTGPGGGLVLSDGTLYGTTQATVFAFTLPEPSEVSLGIVGFVSILMRRRA